MARVNFQLWQPYGMRTPSTMASIGWPWGVGGEGGRGSILGMCMRRVMLAAIVLCFRHAMPVPTLCRGLGHFWAAYACMKRGWKGCAENAHPWTSASREERVRSWKDVWPHGSRSPFALQWVAEEEVANGLCASLTEHAATTERVASRRSPEKPKLAIAFRAMPKAAELRLDAP
ncbi:hypothetical protein GQ53DRAFT_461616 [Thozetella sp. PMI_491]|nr:hypothetical protein GQ53DRAFT_461616 [Thozetella sp. PMI_491]